MVKHNHGRGNMLSTRSYQYGGAGAQRNALSPPVAFDYPVSFLAASSLLIYRIIHQTLLQEILPDRLPLRCPDHRKRPLLLCSLAQTHKRGQVSSEHIDSLKGKYECYLANMHRTSLLFPFWKQTATDTACCARCEITQSLSTSSNSHAQTQRQPGDMR